MFSWVTMGKMSILTLCSAIFLVSGNTFVKGQKLNKVHMHRSDDEVHVDSVMEKDNFNTRIVGDYMQQRGYIHNNTIYLKTNGISANGMILNVLANFQTRRGAEPKWNHRLHTIDLLVGMSLVSAQQMFQGVNFDQINDKDKAVEWKDTNANGKLQISNFVIPEKQTNMVGEPQPSHLIEMAPDVTLHPYHMSEKDKLGGLINLSSKHISFIYAAKNLSINKRLLNLNWWDREDAYREVTKISNMTDEENKKIEWIKELNGKKFSVDFAVLKIAVPFADFRGDFKRRMDRILSKQDWFSKIYKLSVPHPASKYKPLVSVDGKMENFVMGGYNSLNEHQSHLRQMRDMKIHIKRKTTQIENKKPSHIKSYRIANTSCSIECEIFYADYFDLIGLGTEHELHNIRFAPNDAKGILGIEFQLRHKATGITSPIKRQMQVGKMKTSLNTTSDIADIPDTIPVLQNKYSIKAQWWEVYVKFGILEMDSIYEVAKQTDRWKQLEGYIALDHRIGIANWSMGGDGVVTTSFLSEAKPSNKLNRVVGLYQGHTSWKSWWGDTKHQGQIMLLYSPTRYDVFGMNNNLSKPSLLDVLLKKKDIRKIPLYNCIVDPHILTLSEIFEQKIQTNGFRCAPTPDKDDVLPTSQPTN